MRCPPTSSSRLAAPRMCPAGVKVARQPRMGWKICPKGSAWIRPRQSSASRRVYSGRAGVCFENPCRLAKAASSSSALLERLVQLAQQLALVLGQLDGCLQRHVAVQVTRIAGAQALDALAAQAEGLAVLGALGQLDLGLAASAWAPRSLPPSAAVVMPTGTVQCRSSPSRSKMSCCLMRISMYRSPAGPPLVPGSPLPASGCACLR
jgi:hypothetical protein